MKNRIDRTFAGCRQVGRKAVVVFVSAGDPSLAVTEELLVAAAGAGADVIELGVPFSDPMADGPTIQAASQRALAAGTTLRQIIAMAGRVRQRIETPLVLFSYYNVILQYGVEACARDSAAAGIDGWLVVDVPAEESLEIRPVLRECGLYWITLLAPTTSEERARRLLADAEGFVYCITVTGVTGARRRLPRELAGELARVRGLSPVPVVAGFGIATPEMAREVATHADGIVVGSALVKILADASEAKTGVAAAACFVRELAAAVRQSAAVST